MIREKLIANEFGGSGKFRWRGHEVSRIEGLSDAVFAFAITLLVVSLEVPKTFAELAETMHGFGAFLISFISALQFFRCSSSSLEARREQAWRVWLTC